MKVLLKIFLTIVAVFSVKLINCAAESAARPLIISLVYYVELADSGRKCINNMVEKGLLSVIEVASSGTSVQHQWGQPLIRDFSSQELASGLVKENTPLKLFKELVPQKDSTSKSPVIIFCDSYSYPTLVELTKSMKNDAIHSVIVIDAAPSVSAYGNKRYNFGDINFSAISNRIYNFYGEQDSWRDYRKIHPKGTGFDPKRLGFNKSKIVNIKCYLNGKQEAFYKGYAYNTEYLKDLKIPAIINEANRYSINWDLVCDVIKGNPSVIINRAVIGKSSSEGDGQVVTLEYYAKHGDTEPAWSYKLPIGLNQTIEPIYKAEIEFTWNYIQAHLLEKLPMIEAISEKLQWGDKSSIQKAFDYVWPAPAVAPLPSGAVHQQPWMMQYQQQRPPVKPAEGPEPVLPPSPILFSQVSQQPATGPQPVLPAPSAPVVPVAKQLPAAQVALQALQQLQRGMQSPLAATPRPSAPPTSGAMQQQPRMMQYPQQRLPVMPAEGPEPVLPPSPIVFSQVSQQPSTGPQPVSPVLSAPAPATTTPLILEQITKNVEYALRLAEHVKSFVSTMDLKNQDWFSDAVNKLNSIRKYNSWENPDGTRSTLEQSLAFTKIAIGYMNAAIEAYNRQVQASPAPRPAQAPPPTGTRN